MLSEQVSIGRRFQRSIRLDSDLSKSDALTGFVCQRSAADGLVAMAGQIAHSKQRAFTWTGPYGGGKSSLAVALAGLLGPKGPVRTAAAAALGQETSRRLLGSLQPGRDGWLVVPVVGRRGDPVPDIAETLEEARRRDHGNRGRPRAEAKTGRELIARLLQEAEERPRDGVLVVIDEMGKFLEGAASESGDIYFFQELAEAASRANGKLVVVGILHQSFEQYASRLGREVRDEWAKIQGRFTDVPLIAAVDEVVDLLGRAIVTRFPHPKTGDASSTIAKSMRSRRPSLPDDLGERLDRCWPLHPVTAAVLGPMSRRRFGQNERSVFGFLTAAEPGGFQEFLRDTPAGADAIFGPERFWDYLRVNLEPAILASNDSHRWALCADAAERCEGRGTALHVKLVKSLALIDMFRNGSGLSADRLTLALCVPEADKKAVDAALADLERWSIAVFRKHAGAWSIYAGSDFDIDGAVAAAIAATSELDLRQLSKLAGLQPVLAKRHYQRTGTLRWFRSELINLSDIEKVVAKSGDAAGQFLLAIPAADDDATTASSKCRAASGASDGHLVAVGLASNAFRIRDLGRELLALEAVRAGRPELDGDSVARREISARMAAISAALEEDLRVGFMSADWYVEGDKADLPRGATLSRLASDLSDKRYDKAPQIKSELINRERPSTNTQRGVRDLLRAMIASPDQLYLGIEAFPVHRGLYSTVLAQAGFHRKRADGSYGFGEPDSSVIGQSFKPAWKAAEDLFAAGEAPIALNKLYTVWQDPPYGLRRGILPILALSFMMANRDRFAVYGMGKFQSDIDDYLVDLLLQDETLVAIRRVNLDNFHGSILDSMIAAVEAATGRGCPPEPLEVARRLVRFTRELPNWTHRTLGLEPGASEVRRVLLQADDPHKALFVDIPAIFGDDVKATAEGIRTSLGQLRSAYPGMLDDLSRKMLRALGHEDGQDLQDLRGRAEVVRDLTGDLRVDAFASRLASYYGETSEIEAIASLALNRPPRDWTDRDPDQAALALADFALKFRHAETLARVKGRKPSRDAMAFVVGTGESGQTVMEEFEVADRDRSRIMDLAQEFAAIAAKSGADRNIVLAALAQTGMGALTTGDKKTRKVG